MKKTLMMIALAVCSATAYAQDDLVKEAEKLAKKGEVAAAVDMITPALTSAETVDKAKAWNVLATIYYNQYEAMFTQQQEAKIAGKESGVNEAAMYEAYYKALEAAIECDKYDVLPNEKGKVKIRFRSGNATKLANFRVQLISGGQVAYNAQDFANAIKYWKMYVDSAKSPLFTGVDMSQDPYYHEICYYVGLASYQQKDYQTAIDYANLASQDSSKIKDANEIILFSKKDGAKTQADSLAYLQTVKEFHKNDPAEPRFFNLLMEYYTRPGRQAELQQWVSEEIALDPTNKMAWALKGEAEMNTEQWDEAIVSYKKALELDPTFVQVIFNTGVCLNSKAIQLKDKLADKNTGRLTKANADQVKGVLEEAKTYLLKTREMDPMREKVNWVYPLYQIYYALDDQAGVAEMEQLLNNN